MMDTTEPNVGNRRAAGATKFTLNFASERGFVAAVNALMHTNFTVGQRALEFLNARRGSSVFGQMTASSTDALPIAIAYDEMPDKDKSAFDRRQGISLADRTRVEGLLANPRA